MIKQSLALSLFATLFSAVATPATLLINFETVPSEPTGPSLFALAGPAQTISVPGVATIIGGVVLGNESNLPAQSFGTSPNIYGTAGFGHNLSSTLTIAFNSAFPVTQVSFPLFNGATITESYVISAYNGAALVATQTLSSLAPNANGGYSIADLLAANITSLTITPTALNDPAVNGWDFSIDSVALNETVQQAFAPEPGTFALLGVVAIFMVIGTSHRRLKQNNSVVGETSGTLNTTAHRICGSGRLLPITPQ